MNTALATNQKIVRRNVELSYDANKSYSFIMRKILLLLPCLLYFPQCFLRVKCFYRKY